MAPIRMNTSQKRLLAVTLCAIALCASARVMTINDSEDSVDSKPAMPREKSTHKAAARGNQSRAYSPRVTFLVVQTRYFPGWCRMLVSSIFSNVTVVTIGAGRLYRHTRRPQWTMEYVEAEKLRDEDVLVVVDGADNIFTDAVSVQKALQKFIAATAPTASAFDGASVRRGETLAPIMFGGDFLCYSPEASEFFGKAHANEDAVPQCEREMKNARRRAGMDNELGENPARPGKSTARYLNAGGFIARVWALKQAAPAFRAMLVGREHLWCDQSIWTVLYVWSLTQNSGVPPAMVLPLGLIGIDFHFNFFLDMFPVVLKTLFRPWSESTVSEVVAAGHVPFPRFFDIAGYPNATPMSLHIFGFFQKKKENLQRTIPYLPWLREVFGDEHTLQRAKQRLAEETFVDVRESAGTQRLLRFADVCRVEDVLSITWLSMAHGKM